MISNKLNNRIVEIEKLIGDVPEEYLDGQSEELIAGFPTFNETGLYKNLKQALQLEQQKSTCIKQLKSIVNSVIDIMSRECSLKYGFNFEDYNIILQFLKNSHYYSKEEQQAYFKSQLLDNAKEYNIYIRNGLILKNLFDGSQKVFQTEESLNDFMSFNSIICITVKALNFEEEYQKYYLHLLQHGHEYTANDIKHKPGCVAETLANMFGGQVDYYGLPFYTDNFRYPVNFDNKKYIEYIGKLREMRKHQKFMRAYKIFQRMKFIDEELSSVSNNYEEFRNKVDHTIFHALPHDILFLQKLYKYNRRRFGLNICETIDYYKALDMQAYRDSLDQFNIGTWKSSENFYTDPMFETFDDRINIFYKYFDWQSFKERTIINDEVLLNEVSSSRNSCTKKEINELTKNRCVIISNENLNYTTLLEEYYANFGMEPVEFCQMIQEKYGCEVEIPEKKTSRTKMAIYSNNR